MKKRALRFSVLLLVVVAGLLLVRLGLMDRAVRRFARSQAAYAPESVEALGPLPEGLVESSGLGVSRAHPGILWTHNDSGDRPRFYALDRSASLLATYEVEGARAMDWEDMALAPCPPDVEPSAATAGDCLFLADTGDNRLARASVTVYVVPEPDPEGPARTVAPLGRLRLRYPDGAHDVEGLAVGSSGSVILVTKGRTGEVLLFSLPGPSTASHIRSDSVVTLPAGRKLPIEPSWRLGRVVTGAAMSPDGAILAVRTYSQIYFFPWPLPEDLAGVGGTCFLGTLEPSGEAVDWEDSTALLLTSETSRRGRGQLIRVRCYPPAGRGG